ASARTIVTSPSFSVPRSDKFEDNLIVTAVAVYNERCFVRAYERKQQFRKSQPQFLGAHVVIEIRGPGRNSKRSPYVPYCFFDACGPVHSDRSDQRPEHRSLCQFTSRFWMAIVISA